jgi:hypothetical protein
MEIFYQILVIPLGFAIADPALTPQSKTKQSAPA